MEERDIYNSGLNNISPFDGREILFTKDLRKYLSEGALHKYRALVQIENLIFLSESDFSNKPIIKDEEKNKLRNLLISFDAKAVAEYDHFQRHDKGPFEHDVKSVEMYLRELLKEINLTRLSEFIHFPLTSEDVNNIAYNLMLRDALNKVWLPKLLEVLDLLSLLSNEYNNVPVIGKTHGMNASPTTVGKRFAYILDKIMDSLIVLKTLKLKSKFSGSVGNYNSTTLLFPEFNMELYSRRFVEKFNFEYSDVENQRISHQHIVRLLNEIQLINIFLLDLCENIRHSIMLGWYYLEKIETHVGSSVMPHKVNPWFFEVGQGYFEISNVLINGSRDHLINSLFERDLTDHPWERIYSEMIGSSLIGISYILLGLKTLKIDKNKTVEDLNNNPEVLSEAIQLAGRALGVNDIYIKIKLLTRGKNISLENIKEIINNEIPDSNIKEILLKTKPSEYIGKAPELAKKVVERYKDLKSFLSNNLLE